MPPCYVPGEPVTDDEVDMESLYHYTTAAGLQGILSRQAVWASDLRFLNDANEGLYAYDVFADSIAQMENPFLSTAHEEEDLERGYEFAVFKEFVASEFSSPEDHVFVTCFCESGDLLSQWRAYGSDHGYSIEFAVAGLGEAAEGRSWFPTTSRLVQVRYGDSASQVALAAMRDVAQDPNLRDPRSAALHLRAMLASIKHPGFREEREWRLVVGFEYEGDYALRFRSTPMAIVPYVEVPISLEMIRGIRIGPGRHVDVREVGVQRLLRHMECDIPITRSEVPLRT